MQLLEAGANFLWDVEFISILSLASSSPVEVELQRLDSEWSITTNTVRRVSIFYALNPRLIRQTSRKREHVRGCMDKSGPSELAPSINLATLWESLPPLNFNGTAHIDRCETFISYLFRGFYSSVEPLATYGPRFQRIVKCHGGPGEVIAEIKGPTSEELSVFSCFTAPVSHQYSRQGPEISVTSGHYGCLPPCDAPPCHLKIVQRRHISPLTRGIFCFLSSRRWHWKLVLAYQASPVDSR